MFQIFAGLHVHICTFKIKIVFCVHIFTLLKTYTLDDIVIRLSAVFYT